MCSPKALAGARGEPFGEGPSTALSSGGIIALCAWLSAHLKKGGGKIMPSRTRAGSVSKGRLWSGRIISGLMVLFLLFDGITKLMRVAPVLEASAQLGYPVSTLVGIGIIALVCTAVYVIPQTSVLGAILLTGYL